MGRRALLTGVLAVAVGSGAVGWFAGQQIKSPAEIAAETEPPAASLITVPVEQLLLSRNVIVRGQASFDDATDIPAPQAIITKVTKDRGEILVEGDVAIEAAGRPLIVLQGDLPVWRPFTPSLEGPDVRQLQESLTRLGLYSGPIDGIYGSGTGSAVKALYANAGYKAVEPTRQELEQVEQAQAAVDAAAREVTSAKAGSSGLPATERLRLEQAIRDAQVQLVLIEADANVLEQAAWDEVAAAMRALAEAQTSGNPIAIAEATEVLSQAQAKEMRVKLEQANLVERATTEVLIAQAALKEATTGAADSGAKQRLSDARTQLTKARETFALIQAEIGISFPESEIIFLASLPREIQSLSVEAGEFAQGSIMRVTGAGVAISGSVSRTERRLIREGMPVIMEDSALGISVEGTIAFVADNPGGPEIASDKYAVRFEPNEQLPEDLLNRNLKVTIPVTSTGGEVFAVPFAAVSAGADGTERVEIANSDGTTRTVEVNRGLSDPSQGLIEVTPVVDGALKSGDRVVVGQDLNLTPNSGSESDSEETDG